MIREVAYLQIPAPYFGGTAQAPRWSLADSVIEWPDGSTLAFGGEVARFLEGYAQVGRPIHFAHVVHILQLFDEKAGRMPPVIVDLRAEAAGLIRAYRDQGRPTRNLGALCGWLCRDVPPLADPPSTLELCLRLSNDSLMAALSVGRWATSGLAEGVEAPALDAPEFAERFLRALRAMTPGAVVAWLKHGRGPMASDPGEAVAESVEALRPRTLAGTLAALSGREKLAGAVPMVARLVAALALPPRRLAHRALPTGGYVDVTNRGGLDQILPGQLAFDEFEFLRRFAEDELLYYHREEPHAAVTDELVLVLDQGVRTWGRVRLALAASALALGKLASRRGIRLTVASTAAPGRRFDPIATDPETLGAFWEASDLSADPSSALAPILDGSSDIGEARDVVVLSHPRSLATPGFAEVVARARAGTRVFTVAVDEPGQVEFREWRGGASIKIGAFRVEIDPPVTALKAKAEGDTSSPWAGDVEPVGYPFRLGIGQSLDRPLFDFDGSGHWLLMAEGRGMLHAWAVDGSRAEVWPRGMADGEVIERVDAVLGVAGGLVVGGRVGKALVAAHYDPNKREVRTLRLGPSFGDEWEWLYARDQHAVVIRGRTYSRALDLSTWEVHRSRDPVVRPKPRAASAFEWADRHPVPPPRIAIVDEARPTPDRGRYVHLDRDSGTVEVAYASPAWVEFTPIDDGHRALRGAWVDQAQLRGNVLALLVVGVGKTVPFLRLFHGPSGVPSRVLAPASDDSAFMLSPDGRLIARRRGDRLLEVRETAGRGQPVLIASEAKHDADIKLALGRYGMILRVGKLARLVRWDGDRLTIEPVATPGTRSVAPTIAWPIDRIADRSTPPPSPLDHDPHRFVACARSGLTAVVDVFGQIALFDSRDRLLALFLMAQGQVAAWMPDGTKLGPPTIIEGADTPHAARKIGQALRQATDAGRPGPSR